MSVNTSVGLRVGADHLTISLYDGRLDTRLNGEPKPVTDAIDLPDGGKVTTEKRTADLHLICHEALQILVEGPLSSGADLVPSRWTRAIVTSEALSSSPIIDFTGVALQRNN